MKRLMLFICLWWPAISISQSYDSAGKNYPVPIRNTENSSKTNLKPEIFTSGFIDIANNGQVNASARLIRLFVGEPGKFVIPLSVYSGVSSNNFQNQQIPGGNRSNDQLGNNFINPLSGLVNVSVEGIIFLNPPKFRITNTGFLYQSGVRMLTGYRTGLVNDPTTGRPINFINSYSSCGMYFQTGAWERNNSRNMGICWIAGRYIICKSGKSQLRNIFPNLDTNGFYYGWSAAWGIEVNNLVNMKLLYYKYNKKPDIIMGASIYQFSFTYSIR